MKKRKYALPGADLEVLDKFVLRQGGTPAWRQVQKSLVEQVIGMTGKDLGAITIDDLMVVRDKITESGFKPNYQRRLVAGMRRFFLWFGKLTGTDFSELKSIKLPKGQWKVKRPEDMITPQVMETILSTARNSRDRAFLAMLWDGSNRPVELLSLNWNDLIRDDYGYSFKTSAKTGRERHIRLTISIPYIEAWKRDYPGGKPKGDDPVFAMVYRPYSRWTRDAASAMIKDIRKVTGLENLKLSLFRPSRITADVKSNMDPAYISMKNWGVAASPMLNLYTNIGADYLDQVALRHAGMAKVEMKKDKEQYKIEVPNCPGCGTMNIPGSAFCATCRAPLTDAARSQVDREKEQLTKDILAKVAEMMSAKK